MGGDGLRAQILCPCAGPRCKSAKYGRLYDMRTVHTHMEAKLRRAPQQPQARNEVRSHHCVENIFITDI
jgi:hypothetical protein